MAKHPMEDFLAAGLSQPSEAAAARAKPLFDRLVREVRESAAAAATQPQPAVGNVFGGGRRYDVALAFLAQAAAEHADGDASAAGPGPGEVTQLGAPVRSPVLADDDEDTQLGAPVRPPALADDDEDTGAPVWSPVLADDDEVTQLGAPVRSPALADDDEAPPIGAAAPPPALAEAEEVTRLGAPAPAPDGQDREEVTQTAVRVPPRPPRGAATVRPGAPRGPASEPAHDRLLQQTADAAMLRTDADGTMAFDIAIRDDVFAELACTISVRAGRATAIFRVGDDNTRRLLEAEAGRLRVALEGRGLKVAEVRVVLDPPR